MGYSFEWLARPQTKHIPTNWVRPLLCQLVDRLLKSKLVTNPSFDVQIPGLVFELMKLPFREHDSDASLGLQMSDKEQLAITLLCFQTVFCVHPNRHWLEATRCNWIKVIPECTWRKCNETNVIECKYIDLNCPFNGDLYFCTIQSNNCIFTVAKKVAGLDFASLKCSLTSKPLNHRV